MIAIIDYGMGNLGSVKNMFKRLGFHQAIITSEIEQIEKAKKLILPGVGSFDKAMNNLLDGGYIPVIEKKLLKNINQSWVFVLECNCYLSGARRGIAEA